MRTILFQVVLLYFFVFDGSTLECYKCKDRTCINVTLNKTKTDECKAGEVCYAHFTEFKTYRGCGNPTACEQNTNEIDCFTCESDLCNSGSSVRASTSPTPSSPTNSTSSSSDETNPTRTDSSISTAYSSEPTTVVSTISSSTKISSTTDISSSSITNPSNGTNTGSTESSASTAHTNNPTTGSSTNQPNSSQTYCFNYFSVSMMFILMLTLY